MYLLELSMEPWAAAKNALRWRHQLLSGFLAKGHLSRVSRLLANDNGDEMIIGALHRSPGSYLTAEEKSRKPVRTQ